MNKKNVKVQKNKLSKRKLQRNILEFLTVLVCLLVVVGMTAAPALAGGGTGGKDGDFAGLADGTEKLDAIVQWIATWAGRIGLVVAFFGALQTVLGFMNDDADSKVRGLKTLAAGFMVWGISQTYTTFFNDATTTTTTTK